jgi:hypothetical protein
MNSIYLGIPVFVSGIKYGSMSEASIECGISYVAFHKAVKKSNYEPCKIKKNIVVLESWVINRISQIAGYVA